MSSLHDASLRISSVYEIGPPSWIKKLINANTLQRELALATTFCDAIGLREPCTIMLKTSMNSTESWPVHGFHDRKRSYMIRQGWRRFCQENSLEQGDICTFNVVETTVWHVVITRYKERINHFCCQESPSASSRKRTSENDRLCSEEQKVPRGSRTSSNLALSKRRCVHEISRKRMANKSSSNGKRDQKAPRLI
uniref:TF-B3 domain-containing protein n=1 Tax=Arundo donax TaxID=35708 RepID=A0A0A9HNV4_ARUDO